MLGVSNGAIIKMERSVLYSATYPRQAPTEVFWRNTAHVEHSVQIYADLLLFLDALEGFASGGLRAGESVIVIATDAHRHALASRLRRRGFDLEAARTTDLFLPIDASGALSHFMVDGLPDEARFNQFVADLVARARGNGRRVRVFGELVAILWDQGNSRATLRLEEMWNKRCEQEAFRLLCAYPQSSFNQVAHESITEICAHHSRVLPE